LATGCAKPLRTLRPGYRGRDIRPSCKYMRVHNMEFLCLAAADNRELTL
jgi:hypothetical protein